MRILILALLTVTTAQAAPREQTEVRTEPGMVSVTLSGNQRSNAARLFRSLDKLEGVPDSDMGNQHYSETKRGNGVYCEMRSGPGRDDTYNCFFTFTTAGEPKALGN